MSVDKRNNIYGYAFISPWIFSFITLTAGPMIVSLVLSFFDYDYLSPAKFVGLGNFKEIFTTDSFFKNSVLITFKYVIIREPLKLAIGLGFAMMLNKLTRFSDFFRTLMYMPGMVSGGVAVSVMWRLLLQKDGMINQVLAVFGLGPVDFLTDPKVALYTLIFTSLYGYPGCMIIFLAGLKNIPEELYEAATVDGAGAWKKFINITIPMVSPTLFYNLVTGIINAFQTFESAFLITQGGPQGSTTFFMLNLYNNAFEYHRAGYASALAWILFAIILVFTLLIFKTSSAWVFYDSGMKENTKKKDKKDKKKKKIEEVPANA